MMAFDAQHRRRTSRPQPFDRHDRPLSREERVMASLSPHLNIMIKAVRRVGARLIRDFGEISSLQVSKKGPGDFVSNADLLAEKTLIELLSQARPDYGILSEETGEIAAQNDSRMTWVIDPIDGTINFLHALPTFSVSVALMEDQTVVCGVIFNPITNELYYAEKGRGAFLMTPTGNIRLRVSGRNRLEDALIASNAFRTKRNIDILTKVSEEVVSVRYNGSSTLSLACAAAGQFDAYVATQFKLWDIAAGVLLVTEAGGFVCDLGGKTDLPSLLESQTLLACNRDLKNPLLEKLGE